MSKTTNYKRVIEIFMSDNYDTKKLLVEIAKNNPTKFLKAYHNLYEKNDKFFEVRSFLKETQKIQAIKMYRAVTGKTLQESKEAVDKIETEMRLRGELK